MILTEKSLRSAVKSLKHEISERRKTDKSMIGTSYVRFSGYFGLGWDHPNREVFYSVCATTLGTRKITNIHLCNTLSYPSVAEAIESIGIEIH